MGDKYNFDFSRIVDNFIDSAKNITDNLVEKGSEFVKDSGLQDLKDYYPFYSWPPLNLYSCEDNSIIFEFGLPGFIKDDVKINFEDDYMIFSAVLSNVYSTGASINFFKKKLKLTDIVEQKYFLPLAKFDRKNYTMHMKNGLLRLVFPSVSEDLDLK